MYYFRNIHLLAVMALSLVMALQDDGGVLELKQCDGEFEETFFNFDIYIENFSEDCQDFEELGKRIQIMIETVESCIPEYEDEFIDATVCPLPSFVGGGGGGGGGGRRRHLVRRKVKPGTYAFSGAGGCKRCRRNRAVRRRARYLAAPELQYHDDNASFEERVCDSLAGSAVVHVAVAERAVAKAEDKLKAMMATAAEKETLELLDASDTDKFVNEAKKHVKECKEEAVLAKVRARFARKACTSDADVAVEVTAEEQQGFETVANDLDKDIKKDAKKAQGGYYKVKDDDIELKTEICKARFEHIKSAFEAEVKRLEAQLDEECDKLKQETKTIEGQMKIAKKKKNTTLLEQLKMDIEMLNDKKEALVDELNSFKEMEEERIENDFEFAMGVIHVQAANTFKDYMEAFADLMTDGLQFYLKKDVNSTCFDKEPSVEVEVGTLDGEDDKIALLNGCPNKVA